MIASSTSSIKSLYAIDSSLGVSSLSPTLSKIIGSFWDDE